MVPCIVQGQVLEVVPDEMGEVIERPAHIGTCYSGSSGLVTIPTPDFQESTAGFSYKTGTWKNDLNIGGKLVKVEKDEQTAGIRFNLSPHVELSANHLRYERRSDPLTKGLSYKEDTTAFGMKYSAHHGSKDICLGFTFAPMSAEELNLADIEQIENLRNVYLTISEEVAQNFTGFLNLTSAFTKKQKMDFGSGIIQEINRKDILIGSFGLEYGVADSASVFCEYKVGNYRDIFQDDSTRHRFHAGFRVGTNNIQAEVLGMNLSESNPTMVLGGTLAF
jgi:hypothetical protein